MQSIDPEKELFDRFRAALTLMTTDVTWPKAFKGGYAHGHNDVRAYWTEQWSEINPRVEPVAFYPDDNGQLPVDVHLSALLLNPAACLWSWRDPVRPRSCLLARLHFAQTPDLLQHELLRFAVPPGTPTMFWSGLA